VFLESGIFFALPGDSLLFTAGVFASMGILRLDILIPFIFICTLLGGIVGYWIGVNIEKLHKYSLFRKVLKKEFVDKAHQFFEKHGKFAIIFSRFVPIIRTFAPIVAGIAYMPYKKFLKYSLISSVLWSTTVTLSGFFLGRQFPGMQNYMPLVITIVVTLSMLPMIIGFFRNRKKS
jgi:membrane-associated protein